MANKPIKTLPAGLRENRLVELHYSVQELLPMVYHLLVTDSGNFVSLTVREKDGGALVIVKKVGDDGQDLVMFCGGYDALSSLLDLDRALSRGAWKEDKPWSPDMGKGKQPRK